MAVDRGVLREISWRDLCPWLVIVRCFGVATRAPVLALATLGVLLMPMGWSIAQQLFISDQALQKDVALRDIVFRNNRVGLGLAFSSPSPNPRLPSELQSGAAESMEQWVHGGRQRLSGVFQSYVEPYRHFFEQKLELPTAAYFLFGAFWTLTVWSVIGGAITRIAVVQFGGEERLGVGDAVKFTLRRFKAYFLAPLFPLLAVVLLVVPCALLGLVMRLDLGVVLGSLLWLFVLLASFVGTMLLLGLFFGWPLMWPAISAEPNGDEFEALHRSYSFTYQKPLRYLFYVLVAWVIGSLGWVLVEAVSQGVIWFSGWAVSWGTGSNRWQEISEASTGSASVLQFGSTILGWWQALINVVAAAYGFSYFWSAASAIYLLRRRDVDETEFDEIYLDDLPPRSLPTLAVDKAGVAKVPDDPLPPPTDSSPAPTTDLPS